MISKFRTREDGAETAEATPLLVLAGAVDPEGGAVTYDLAVASDDGMLALLASASGLAEGSGPDHGDGQTSWRVDVALSGDVYWSARAKDAAGNASGWATPFLLRVIPDEPPTPDDDDGAGDDDPAGDDDGGGGDDDGPGGCACGEEEASLAGGGRPARAPWAAAALLFLALGRRRGAGG